jgi:secondary thiamine-phosphate synthase enzyme
MKNTILDWTLTDSQLVVRSFQISLETSDCLQFIDLTDFISDFVASSNISFGMVNIQSRHTTAAIMINENEPLLLQDIRRTLEEVAPSQNQYRHDDFATRTVNLFPDETENGHSHCKAVFLRTSETVNIVDGVLQLGRWQRIFLVELDQSRHRDVSLMVLGQQSSAFSQEQLCV